MTFLEGLYRFGGAAEVAINDGSAPTYVPEADQRAQVLRLTGTLSAARRLIIPIVRGDYIVLNDTTQSVTVGAQTGSTVALASGTRALICCDGENYYVVSAGTTGGGGGPTTLAGDASGPSGSNVVTHVTGTAATKVNGTTSVALQLGGVDKATLDVNGFTVGSPDVTIYSSSGVPAFAAPNGSLCSNISGNGSLYLRQAGAWVLVK